MRIDIVVCDSAQRLAELYAFRYRIWADELGIPLSSCSAPQMVDASDSHAINYAAIENDTIIGSLRVSDLHTLDHADQLLERYHLQDLAAAIGRPALAHVGRLAVDRDARGGSTLFALLKRAVRDAALRGIRAYCFDCSPYLLRTYEALGAVRTGAAFVDPMFGFKIPLALVQDDHAHFRSVRSPLQRVISQAAGDPAAIAWRAQRSINPQLMPPSDPQHLLRHLDTRFRAAITSEATLLSGLDHAQRQKLLARSTIFHATPGQEVIKPGLREDAVFMVLSGSLDVLDQARPSLRLQTLQPGEFFGEMAWLTGASRHNRVISREPSELLLISADVLRNLLSHSPDIAAIILRNMARTLALRLQASAQRIPAPESQREAA